MFYDFAVLVLRPVVWWGRLHVVGLEHVPETGPLLVVPNHDSQWDPLMVGLAIEPRRRVRFLARANLWHVPGLAQALNLLRQLPVTRGAGDGSALDRAVEALRDGDAVAIFPEGGLSWGAPARARSGVGVLAARCPGVRVVLCAVTGTTDFVRWPRRPRVRVEFMPTVTGQPRPGEDPAALASRLMGEVRARAPVTPAGRGGVVGGPPRVRRKLERQGLLPPSGE
ncbi:MAG: lysophospholipid acyltransferase family protein [Acidobacteriota bacterium]